MLLGLARRTARESRKHHYVTVAVVRLLAVDQLVGDAEGLEGDHGAELAAVDALAGAVALLLEERAQDGVGEV